MQIPYINLPSQHADLEPELLRAVRRVLRHGQFILGPEVSELETRLASYVNVPHVIGVNSGTDALILALRAHGIQPGDEVITVSHSFVANASAICMVGAVPVFVDIDARTMLMDPACLPAALTPRTRAVLPVHLNGFPCEMERIQAFCEQHELILIEDCAQAIGAFYAGRHVGAFGTGCFSLHPLKILSACGDAGFIATRDAALADRLRRLRNIGLRDRDHCDHIGGNTRLDTLQAALLLVKMRHMEAWIEARAHHAHAYREVLRDRVMLPPEHGPHRPVYSAFVIRHRRRDAVIKKLHALGVDAKIHYPVPIHRQKAFAQFRGKPLPVTETTVDQIISLPVTPELTEAGRGHVIEALDAALGEVSHA